MRRNNSRLHLSAWMVAVLFATILLSLSDVSFSLAAPINEPEQGASARPGDGSLPVGNLKYKGGPVVNTAHTTYTIFWIPSGYSVSPRYQSLINGYLQNVARDSGKTTNIYHSITQYSDGNGSVPYQSSFGTTLLLTTPFPSSNCTLVGFATCLSDMQIQSTLADVINAQGWTPGMNKIFFLFLPKGVGSCYSNSSTFCLYNNYCAYHNSFVKNNANVLYGLIGYGMGNSAKCGSFSHPNGDDADTSINLLAHEHTELLTDPLHNAWIDDNGKERSDRCVWQFGAALGWTPYGKYNQIIGNGKYYLQSQWSNQTSKCVLSGM